MGTKKEMIDMIKNSIGNEFYFTENGQEIDDIYDAEQAIKIINSLNESDIKKTEVFEY